MLRNPLFINFKLDHLYCGLLVIRPTQRKIFVPYIKYVQLLGPRVFNYSIKFRVFRPVL